MLKERYTEGSSWSAQQVCCCCTRRCLVMPFLLAPLRPVHLRCVMASTTPCPAPCPSQIVKTETGLTDPSERKKRRDTSRLLSGRTCWYCFRHRFSGSSSKVVQVSCLSLGFVITDGSRHSSFTLYRYGIRGAGQTSEIAN